MSILAKIIALLDLIHSFLTPFFQKQLNNQDLDKILKKLEKLQDEIDSIKTQKLLKQEQLQNKKLNEIKQQIKKLK